MSVAWLQPIPCTIFIASSLPNQMAPQPRVTMSRLVTCHVSRVGSVPVSRVRVAMCRELETTGSVEPGPDTGRWCQ